MEMLFTASQLRDHLDRLIEQYGDLPVVHSPLDFAPMVFVDANNHSHYVSEQVGAIGVDRVRMLRDNPYPIFVSRYARINRDIPTQQVITIA